MSKFKTPDQHTMSANIDPTMPSDLTKAVGEFAIALEQTTKAIVLKIHVVGRGIAVVYRNPIFRSVKPFKRRMIYV